MSAPIGASAFTTALRSVASGSPNCEVTRPKRGSISAALVDPRSRISPLTVRKPSSPIAVDCRPAAITVLPSPRSVWPYWAEAYPPSRPSASTILTTPAMASDPYCAAAPSRRISTRLMAVTGMVLKSTGTDPRKAPLLNVMIDEA